MRAFLVFALRKGDKPPEVLKLPLTQDQAEKIELMYKTNELGTEIEGPGLLLDYDESDKELEWKPPQKLTEKSSP